MGKRRSNPQPLGSQVTRRLGTLGLASGAAVVGTARGGINYVDVTPDQVVASSTFSLDVDSPFGGDATPELQFTHALTGPGTNYFGNGNASAQPTSAFAFIAGFFGAGSIDRYVSNPTSGALIAAMNTAGTQLVEQPPFNFNVISNGQQGLMANHGATDPNFKFMTEGEAFIAFKFQESSSTQNGFGWLRLSVSDNAGADPDGNRITIQDFAWSIDTPISVGQIPEPSAIGMLALGALGLSLMRKRSHSGENRDLN